MPVRFELDRRLSLMRVVIEGALDDARLRELYRTAGERFQQAGARAAILDLSGVTTFEVSSQLIHELAYAPTALPGRETPRFIVAPQPHVYGAMRMFQLANEPARPRLLVVHTPEEAYAELGLAVPRFEAMEA